MLIKYLLVHFYDLILRHSDRLAIRSCCSPINEHLTEFSYQPDTKLHHTHLIDILLHCIEYFRDCILVKFWSCSNNCDSLRDVLLTDMMI